MKYQDFLRNVMSTGGMDSFEQTEQVVDACLDVLGEVLPAPERRMLGAQLPKELEGPLIRRTLQREASLEEF